jgi:N-acetylglucosaminyl-diphospho-decaprenol L-rhamnosyltransferase
MVQNPSQPVDIFTVIVNYRTPQLVIDCLESLAGEAAALTGLRVVVVENGSGDDSAARITDAIARRGWGDWASFVDAGGNLGFAGGNNVALRCALASDRPPALIWLLNPDTVVRPGAAAALVDYLQQHPEVGIVGSRLEDPDGTPQRSAFRFPSIWSELDDALRLGVVSRCLDRHIIAPPPSATDTPTDWVAGASMMLRREVFERVGLLDEGYFMYYEEVDLCRRAAAAGFACHYVVASRVVHLVGQASGVTNTKSPRKRRPRYWFDSRRRYFHKHAGRAATLAIDAVWLVAYALHRVRSWVQRRRSDDPPYLWWDYLRYCLLATPPVARSARTGA